MTAVHVASLIVRTRVEAAHDVAARIARAPSTEIHAVENGKIIVVVESAESGRSPTRWTRSARTRMC